MGTGTQHFPRKHRHSLPIPSAIWTPSFPGHWADIPPPPTKVTAHPPPRPPWGTTNMAFLAEAELSRGLGTAPHAEQGRSRLAQGHRSDLGGSTDTGEGGRHMGSGRRGAACAPEQGGRGGQVREREAG